MIWVVSNHPATRSSLPGLIESRGYSVSAIECGEELIVRIRFQTPVVIVLDCEFPNSFDMLKVIREEKPVIPVIMFGVDDRSIKDRCLLAGASAYVPKGTLDWAELLVEVTRHAGTPPP